MMQHAADHDTEWLMGSIDTHESIHGTVAAHPRVLAHAHRGFRVMGSAATITLVGDGRSVDRLDDLLDRAEQRLRELEGHWSRFLPNSDITRANQAAGQPVSVQPDTIAVVLRSIEAWKQTRGRFDVTVLPALVHHGYRASMASRNAGGASAGRSLAPPIIGKRIAVSGSILVDRQHSTITVPAGAAIDLGGIGKGFAADLVALEMIQAGVAGVMVDVGGDLAVRGMPASSERWLVGIEDPTDPPRLIASVALVIGGMATSGTNVRRWRSSSGETAHHLIDPSTALPSTTTLLSATVLALDTASAEAFATAAMMLSGPEAISMLDDVGLAGLLVTRDGTTLRTRSLRSFAP